jgi:predicted transcriptional regulator
VARDQRVIFRTSAKLKNALKRFVESTDTDMSQFIREAIIEKLERERREEKKKEVLFNEE